MFPESIKPKKTDLINNCILILANSNDADWYPVFHNKRSINKVLNWMQFYKMDIFDVILLNVAFTLTYKQ
jgi:hypothetical protein